MTPLKLLVSGLLMSSALHVHAVIKPELEAVISLDIPPYVMLGARRGLEVEVVREALPEYSIRYNQRPYNRLEQALEDRRVDMAVGVKALNERIFYSESFITFTNVAVSRVEDNFTIDKVEDLKGRRVLTWQGAWRVLGDSFKEKFGPNGSGQENYVEVANQAEQVRLFWNGIGDVLVLDRNVFNHFSQTFGHDMDAVRLHPIFPPVTSFRVGFIDEALRDKFNAGLKALCESGRYARLMKQYRINTQPEVCQPGATAAD